MPSWHDWAIRRLVFAIALMTIAIGGEAQACRQTLTYDPLPTTSTHFLDWKVFAARTTKVTTTNSYVTDKSTCNHHPVIALRILIGYMLHSQGMVILGEVHDSPHHHHVRAELLNLTFPTPTPLVFEHIRKDQQAALDAVGADPGRITSASALLDAISWDKSGWPDKTIFQPLFQRALELQLPILAGHPSRDSLGAVARGGTAALSEDERRRLRLDEPLPEKLQNALLDELEASHCGLMPKTAFGNMATAQRYRDAHMAAAIIAAAKKDGRAVLLTGNGHARLDRGVPFDLRRLEPNREVLSILLIETEDGKTEPNAYVPRDPDGHAAADIILFTPRTQRTDPCTEMRERFGKRK